MQQSGKGGVYIMKNVRVLHDHVGEWMAGDIVVDAPAGLIDIAEKGICNAATGKPLAEIVEDSPAYEVSEEISILSELTEKAISYGIPDAETLSITELISAIVQVEWDKRDKEAAYDAALLKEKADQDAAHLAKLIKRAKELKIEGYTKMDAKELEVAIFLDADKATGEEDGK